LFHHSLPTLRVFLSCSSLSISLCLTPSLSLPLSVSLCLCLCLSLSLSLSLFLASLFSVVAQVIFNMITYERMMRMDKLEPNTRMTDKHVYEYIPRTLYRDVLDKLSLLSPPSYHTSIEFKVSCLTLQPLCSPSLLCLPALPPCSASLIFLISQFSPTVIPISYLRMAPSGKTPEHILRAAEWALPPLIHWLNPKIIVWALGLLMCEVSSSSDSVSFLLSQGQVDRYRS
jgi:hypothetical protein